MSGILVTRRIRVIFLEAHPYLMLTGELSFHESIYIAYSYAYFLIYRYYVHYAKNVHVLELPCFLLLL